MSVAPTQYRIKKPPPCVERQITPPPFNARPHAAAPTLASTPTPPPFRGRPQMPTITLEPLESIFPKKISVADQPEVSDAISTLVDSRRQLRLEYKILDRLAWQLNDLVNFDKKHFYFSLAFGTIFAVVFMMFIGVSDGLNPFPDFKMARDKVTANSSQN